MTKELEQEFLSACDRERQEEMHKPFENGESVEPVYDEQCELLGVRFNTALKGKELDAAKTEFFAMMRAAINKEEQS